MTKNEFKRLINECLMEVTLPPGFSSGDFESIEDFSGSGINEAEGDEPLLGAPVTDLPPEEMGAYIAIGGGFSPMQARSAIRFRLSPYEVRHMQYMVIFIALLLLTAMVSCAIL